MLLALESFVLAWFLRISKHNVMRESRKFCQRGREDPNITKSEPSSARQRKAI